MQTVDFFPPIVDDPYDFGAIAAVNAVSDIYAMGAVPLLALNLVCFPEDLDKDVLYQILKGGADVAQEAGFLIVGGHTITDKEPKYGMAVTGIARPDQIVTNAGARPGDVLVLTKPIGTGIITTAAKNGKADSMTLAGAIKAMRTLNHQAAHAMGDVGAHACTDITGFGLVGHLHSMMKAGHTTATVRLSAVPLLPGVRALLASGIAPGGTHRNWQTVGQEARWHASLSKDDQLLLCDAQTAGGLLISLPEAKAATLLRELAQRGVTGHVVGAVSAWTGATIVVEP